MIKTDSLYQITLLPRLFDQPAKGSSPSARLAIHAVPAFLADDLKAINPDYQSEERPSPKGHIHHVTARWYLP
jgi:hypothetical protein